MGWWPTRHRPIARAWNELVPKVLKNRKCLDTYELLNKNTAEPHQRFSATSKPIGREGIRFLVGSTHDQLGSQGANSRTCSDPVTSQTSHPKETADLRIPTDGETTIGRQSPKSRPRLADAHT